MNLSRSSRLTAASLLAVLAVLFACVDPAPGLVGFAAVAALIGGCAAAVASTDLVPGRERLRSFVQRQPGTSDPRGLLRPPGRWGNVVNAITDFTERLDEWVSGHRSARHRAEQTERWESEFFATVSHELRTPLNAILGFSRVLLDEIDGPLDESQREDVATIHEAGLHLQSLVDDVLDLARIESGLLSLEARPVSVGPVVREVVRLLEAQRADRPVVIEARVDPELPEVSADPKRLRQIVMNLATNALKFTDRGSVVVEASHREGEVRIAVRDTGSGIRREEMGVIFEEFRQVQSARRVTQGSGLGLAICKRLVDLHGGRIDVESVVGSGSTFTVSLPARERA